MDTEGNHLYSSIKLNLKGSFICYKKYYSFWHTSANNFFIPLTGNFASTKQLVLSFITHVLKGSVSTWQDAGIGTSIDSFYEYLLKAYILFGDEEYLYIFQEAYGSAMHHLHKDPW